MRLIFFPRKCKFCSFMCHFPPIPRTVTSLGPVTLLPPCTALRRELPRGEIKQTTVPWPTLWVPIVAAAALKLGHLEDVDETCLCRHFRPKRQTLLLASLILVQCQWLQWTCSWFMLAWRGGGSVSWFWVYFCSSSTTWPWANHSLTPLKAEWL